MPGELPPENSNTEDGVSAVPNTEALLASSDLDDNWKCDVDGQRMENHERMAVGAINYSVRKCSANPNHTKMVPV